MQQASPSSFSLLLQRAHVSHVVRVLQGILALDLWRSRGAQTRGGEGGSGERDNAYRALLSPLLKSLLIPTPSPTLIWPQ